MPGSVMGSIEPCLCFRVVSSVMPGAKVKVVKPLEICCSQKEDSEDKAGFRVIVWLEKVWFRKLAGRIVLCP